jgi:energy-coupling factor transporter ATP-binding protein EcfA2
LRGIPPERIDRLALYLPEDTVSVSFREAGSGNEWRSLSQGSPGQQTAALLAFVLGFGDEPIILDQPEDDLDSTLIYELLVNRFREIKATRQMIVVTHNPNIVVHGDAEYVVSLNVNAGQTLVGCHGGLQERGVRDEICRVMEGGREAFRSRYRRIIPPPRAGQ